MKHTSFFSVTNFLLSAYFVICSLLPGRAQAQSSTTFYVAANGSSTNPGTMASPFARPEDALNAINKITGPLNAIVSIRGGDYHFSKSLSITQDGKDSSRHISFASYQNEKVRFLGSAKLDNKQFTLVNDPNILKRLPAPAQGNVYVIDLRAAGITDYGKKVPHGYKNTRNAALELFYNDSPLTIARYPNQGYLPIGPVSDPGAPSKNGQPGRGAKWTFADPRINNWKQADNAWVGGYFSYGYSDDYIKVDTLGVADHTIRLKDPASYSVYSSDDLSNDMLKNGQKTRGFYIYNLLEEIDQPGEWYLDESAGKLYCWPPDNALTTTADVEVSLLEQPIVQLANTSNISFSGIAFEYSRGIGMTLNSTRHTTITHCSFDDLGTLALSAQTRPGSADNTNLMLKSCSICNTGTGGIFLNGGDKVNLISAGNTIDNCEISNYSRIDRTFSPAIMSTSVGATITHNYIHDAPDHAILFWGNDNVIAYNHIANVLYYIADAGAVGTGRDISSTGNVISNNFFENIVSRIDASVAAVYLDDGSSGMEVDDNVFYKAGTAGSYHYGAVHVNGGSDNTFKNNYFIDCATAFSNSPWKDAQWKEFVSSPVNAKIFRPGVDITSAAYQKYGHLKKLMDTTNIAPRQNFIFNTFLYNVGAFSGGATSFVVKNSYTATGDPGFADKSKPDFTLTNVPAALQQAADWKPVPFKQIGIQK